MLRRSRLGLRRQRANVATSAASSGTTTTGRIGVAQRPSASRCLCSRSARTTFASCIASARSAGFWTASRSESSQSGTPVTGRSMSSGERVPSCANISPCFTGRPVSSVTRYHGFPFGQYSTQSPVGRLSRTRRGCVPRRSSTKRSRDRPVPRRPRRTPRAFAASHPRAHASVRSSLPGGHGCVAVHHASSTAWACAGDPIRTMRRRRARGERAHRDHGSSTRHRSRSTHDATERASAACRARTSAPAERGATAAAAVPCGPAVAVVAASPHGPHRAGLQVDAKDPAPSVAAVAAIRDGPNRRCQAAAGAADGCRRRCRRRMLPAAVAGLGFGRGRTPPPLCSADAASHRCRLLGTPPRLCSRATATGLLRRMLPTTVTGLRLRATATVATPTTAAGIARRRIRVVPATRRRDDRRPTIAMIANLPARRHAIVRRPVAGRVDVRAAAVVVVRLDVDVALLRALPPAADPHPFVTVPVPVAVDPRVAVARRRGHRFVERLGRHARDRVRRSAFRRRRSLVPDTKARSRSRSRSRYSQAL